jgi:hypothetical protein
VTVTLIAPNGARRGRQQARHIYSAAELVRMVRQTALTVEAATGLLDERKLTLNATGWSS